MIVLQYKADFMYSFSHLEYKWVSSEWVLKKKIITIVSLVFPPMISMDVIRQCSYYDSVICFIKVTDNLSNDFTLAGHILTSLLM